MDGRVKPGHGVDVRMKWGEEVIGLYTALGRKD
jgi:hypothetical protein